MSKRQPYGNIKMKGKKTVKNPCPCCDTIENKKKIEPTQRTTEDYWEVWDSMKYGTGPLTGDY